jgi:redox-sensitive bicupin YhaK (pirin superfamily)
MTETAILSRTRRVQRRLRGIPASDGAGVKLTRVIGRPGLEELDPFLLLDEFGSDRGADYIAGFPDHPHRGFETVTYMLAGRMRHGDNQGNVGLLGPGSVQWMTAGRGIIHSEMPEQEDGLMAGFQLWVNLPAKDKMCPPRYQDIPPEQIPMVEPAPGVRVKVIAGRVGETKGAVDTGATEPTYLDVHLAPGAAFTHPVTPGHNAFVYVYEGAAEVGLEGSDPVGRGEIAVLGDGDAVRVAATDGPARLLLIAGKPLKEPIARHGPFVMNTMAEIREAVEDYMAGRF